MGLIGKTALGTGLLWLSIALGIIVRQKGAPYNVLYFGAHKIFAVAFWVLFTSGAIKLIRQPITSHLLIPVITVVSLASITLVLTGVLLTLEKYYLFMKAAHKISTLTLLVAYIILLIASFKFKNLIEGL